MPGSLGATRLLHQDVINCRTKLEQLLFRYHHNDALSVRMLYKAITNKVCSARHGPQGVCHLADVASVFFRALPPGMLQLKRTDSAGCTTCVHTCVLNACVCVLQFFVYREQQTSTTERHPDGRPVELNALLLGIMTV